MEIKMSILDPNNNPQVEIPKAKMAANRLIQMTRQTYAQMTQSFNMGSKVFWANPNGVTPAEIAAELDTNAVEIFQLHGLLGQLLAQVQPESIAEGSSLVGDFTMNQDGTVTINEAAPE